MGAAVGVAHRTGLVPIGEAAVAITAAPHRSAAYEANRYVIEAIEERLPIWKRALRRRQRVEAARRLTRGVTRRRRASQARPAPMDGCQWAGAKYRFSTVFATSVPMSIDTIGGPEVDPGPHPRVDGGSDHVLLNAKYRDSPRLPT